MVNQMSLLTIRAKIKPDAVGEVEATANEMFAAVARHAPENIRCASFKRERRGDVPHPAAHAEPPT